MPDDKLIFGELDGRGGIKQDVFICAVSGQPIESGDALVTVAGTRRFYRVKAPIYWRLPEDVQAALDARAQALDSQASTSGVDETAPKPKGGK